MEARRYRSPLRSPGGAAPPEALYDRVRSVVKATPAPATRTRTRNIAALAAVAALTAAVVLIASELVYGRVAVGLQVGTRSMLQLALTSVLLVGLVAASTWAAVWRGRNGLGPRAAFLALAAGLAAPAYAALVLPIPVHIQGAGVPWVEISPWGARCAPIAAIVGVIAIVSFAAALRRAAPVASRLRGAALGAAAGAWAGLAVFIFCPSGDQQHLLLGHVAPVMGLTLLGGFALSRALRP